MLEQKIRLKTAHVNTSAVVYVVQNDTGRSLLCFIEDYDIPEGSTSEIIFKTPSGKKVPSTGTIIPDSNSIKADIPAEAIAEYGKIYAKLEITYQEKMVSTFTFVLDAQRDISSDSGSGSGSTGSGGGNTGVIISIDSVLSAISTNPVQNKVVTAELEKQAAQIQKNTSDISQLSEDIITQAEPDEDGIVSFKNSQGITLFTLDLSEFSGGGNVYGELVLSAEVLSVGEGASNTFAVKLASAPTTNQAVYLAASDNTKLSISPSTLTFSPDNWDTEQTVTVTAEHDEDAVDETITVSLTSKKVSGKVITVLIADDEVENPFINNMASLIYYTDIDTSASNYTHYDTAIGETIQDYLTKISAFKHISTSLAMTVTEAYNKIIESGEFALMLVTDQTIEGAATDGALSSVLQNSYYEVQCGRIARAFNNTWDNITIKCNMTYINSNGEQSAISENVNVPTVISNLAMFAENWLYTIATISLKKNGEIDWYAGSDLIYTTPTPEGFVKWDMSTVTSAWNNWLCAPNNLVDHWIVLDKAATGDEIKSYYEYLASKRDITSF